MLFIKSFKIIHKDQFFLKILKDVNKFVEVMLNNMDYDKNKKLEITLAVIELFNVNK